MKPMLTVLMLVLAAWGGRTAAQSPRATELLLDSLPADSVKCGGLTFQFARFFKEHISALNIYNVPAIDSWVWNRTDSVHTYDAKMLAAVNEKGLQISFLSSADVGHSFGDFTPLGVREVVGRSDYATGPVLPHVSLGRRILTPDNDKDLDHGVTLYCGATKLGLLHKKAH